MSDIFISYSQSDREKAILATALQQEAWSVWWDRNTPPGRTFDEVIEQRLESAKCVILLRSKAPAISQPAQSLREPGEIVNEGKEQK